MDKLAVGDVLEVLADDPAAEEDLKAWAKRTNVVPYPSEGAKKKEAKAAKAKARS